MNKVVGALAQKEMTRKEFLITLGAGAASILGISSVFRLLNGKPLFGSEMSTGYGSSPYGGRQNTFN